VAVGRWLQITRLAVTDAEVGFKLCHGETLPSSLGPRETILKRPDRRGLARRRSNCPYPPPRARCPQRDRRGRRGLPTSNFGNSACGCRHSRRRCITHAAHLFGRPNRRQLTPDAPERMFSSRGEETAVPHLLSRRPDFTPLVNRACGAWPTESQCPRLRAILDTRCVSMLLRGLLSDCPLADDRRELRLLQGLDGYCAGALEPYPFQILKDPARQLEVSCIDPLRKAAVNWV
jgi:hypothetical protein